MNDWAVILACSGGRRYVLGEGYELLQALRLCSSLRRLCGSEFYAKRLPA